MINSEGLRPTVNGRKPLGKLASRLEEVKNPWRQVTTLELSHNEAARLATDALLEHGEREYRRVLSDERELNFLSPLEIRYITENAVKVCGHESNGIGLGLGLNYWYSGGDGDAVSELTSGTYFPMMSDEEPPILELGWPDSPARYGPSETQIYFQRDKSHNVKDLIRSLINKANKVIALVMDAFTDVDLLCDLMEASNKRKVPVYMLLDEKNLNYFTEMCSTLDIQKSHLSNMRIRSVCGDTYCTKSGKKFTGQVLEKFMIIDCEEVIAGSYSFTWLSAQVHCNMVMHFSGRITDIFDREFRCLYADSKIIDCFYNPEDEGTPFYPPYKAIMPPSMGMGLDFLGDSRQRGRVGSENSSSPSSDSFSSVKTAPGKMSTTAYKFTQIHNMMQPNDNTHFSPERGGERVGQTQAQPALRISTGKGSTHNLVTERPLQNYGQQIPERLPQTYGQQIPERPLQTYGHTSPERLPQTFGHPSPERSPQTHGQPMGIEWSKPNPGDIIRSNMDNTSSKFQALGLYDHKLGKLHNTGPSTSSPNLNPTSPPPTPSNETKVTPKQRTYSNQFLNKLQERFMFSSKQKDKDKYKDKDILNSQNPLSPREPSAWGGQELCPVEPESQQSPPPPPPPQPNSPSVRIKRNDLKRMTLGHSKLDLVNQYNKMHKPVYSRFELKNSKVTSPD